MRSTRHTIAIVLACAVATAQDAPMDAASAFDQLEKKWDDLDALRANYTSTMPSMQPDGNVFTVQAEGTLEMKKQKRMLTYRLDQNISVLNPDGAVQSTSRTVTLFDGQRTYVANDIAGSKSVLILSPEVESSRIPLDARSLLVTLRKLGELTLAPDEAINGIDTFAFEGAPIVDKASETKGAAKMRVNIDKTTGVPIHWKLLSAAGETVAEAHYTDIEINPDLDPALFVFQVPVGAAVIDMTATEGAPAKP